MIPENEIIEKNKEAVHKLKVFDCPICMCECEIDGAITLNCSHHLNVECLQHYLEGAIKERKVLEKDLVCPYENCGAFISDDTIAAVVSPEILAKLSKFRMLEANWGDVFLTICDLF